MQRASPSNWSASTRRSERASQRVLESGGAEAREEAVRRLRYLAARLADRIKSTAAE
jgi:hypothetical protein